MPDTPTSELDLKGMRAALDLARVARDLGEVPVGAVVVIDDTIVGAAHNETVTRTDPTAHAEWLAIHQALDTVGSDRLTRATLYVTLEPCAQCGGAIVLTKVERVVFGAWDEKAGMSGSVGDLLRHPRLNHQAEVIGGVLAAECGSLLQEFFTEKRAKSVAGQS